MALAARIRHDVIVVPGGRIGVLEDPALSWPDNVEHMGSHIPLGHGGQTILVEC